MGLEDVSSEVEHFPSKCKALSSNSNTAPQKKAITVEYYSAIKKNKILSFAATRMKLEDFMLSEISQAQKNKY
jgi:ribosomal protein L30E